VRRLAEHGCEAADKLTGRQAGLACEIVDPHRVVARLTEAVAGAAQSLQGIESEHM
jgi:hypothetical protein